MAGRSQKSVNGKLLRAAAVYGQAAIESRSRGKVPMDNGKSRQAAARLIEATKAFHRDWTALRSGKGRPPQAADQPLQPPQTAEGAVIRAAKALGHLIYSPEAPKEHKSAMLKRLLAASESMARNHKED